ncbi:hypothetical protein LEN26_002196 [Aphanomyces euteiches]|nr:hypothetical protein AeMF1_005281 [Aphanomyces euteiches]KAH9131155.1 hypothetical protein AeNC1_019750 [Aphanomyces euteiches]KAH9159706.1 hypothetical protein LEN26_002196 [Aphanomyces euteiches]
MEATGKKLYDLASLQAAVADLDMLSTSNLRLMKHVCTSAEYSARSTTCACFETVQTDAQDALELLKEYAGKAPTLSVETRIMYIGCIRTRLCKWSTSLLDLAPDVRTDGAPKYDFVAIHVARLLKEIQHILDIFEAEPERNMAPSDD